MTVSLSGCDDKCWPFTSARIPGMVNSPARGAASPRLGPGEPPGGPPQQPPRRDDGDGDDDRRTGALTLTRTRTKKPSMYKVLMLNDDYTPMEFVVDVLQRIFQKNRDEATQVMLHVHQKGVGVCGVYTYEIAETKVTQTVDYARKNQHPLQCTLEKE